MRAPVRHLPLVTQVSTQFRAQIESGHWAVGTKIPGEHELSDDLGVSRATVREALRGLTLTGLLEPRIGDGTYVRATNEITGVLVREQLTETLDHVLDARAGLEAASARLAARDATQDALSTMREALDARAHAMAADDLTAYTEADAIFHRAVVHASGNPVLIRLYDAVAETVDASIRHTAALPEDPRLTAAHQDVYDAVRAGDAEGAARLAYALIESVRSSSGPTSG